MIIYAICLVVGLGFTLFSAIFGLSSVGTILLMPVATLNPV